MRQIAVGLLTTVLLGSGALMTAQPVEAAVSMKATKSFAAAENVALNKTWTVSFNKAIQQEVDLSKYVEVKDKDGQLVDIEVSTDVSRKKLYVKPTNKYMSATKYVLTVKKGLPSDSGKVLKDDVEKVFTTLNAVHFLNYAKSYEVNNTSTSDTTITLENAADIIIYDKANQVKTQYMAVKTAKLAKNQRATISYMNLAQANEPQVKSGTATIQQSNTAAFTVLKLQKDGTVNIKNNNVNDSIYVHLNDIADEVTYEKAVYRANDTAASIDISSLKSSSRFMLNKQYETVLSNITDQPFTLYIPNQSTQVKEVNEVALVKHTLPVNQSVIISSKILGEANNNMAYLMTDESNKGTYNYATYTEEAASSSFGEAVLSKQYVDSDVVNGGENVIENTSNHNITLYGAARVALFKNTAEKPLTYYTLNAGKSMRVSTSETRPAFWTNFAAKNAKDQQYNKISYDEYQNEVTKEEQTISKNTHFEDSVFIGNEEIIENVSAAPIEFFGPSRYVQFNDSDEKAFVYYTVKPGEKVKIASTEKASPTSNPNLSKVTVQDTTKTGAYVYTRYTSTGDFMKTETEKFNYYNNKSASINFGGYTIFENTGNIELTLFGSSRYITFTK